MVYRYSAKKVCCKSEWLSFKNDLKLELAKEAMIEFLESDIYKLSQPYHILVKSFSRKLDDGKIILKVILIVKILENN